MEGIHVSAVVALLADAAAAGVTFYAEGPGQIEMRAKKKPPAELIATIRAAKPALLCILGALAVEIPTEWREGARRLQVMQTPPDLAEARWRALASDTAIFLAGRFAAQAAALGWTTFDLWGCHPRRPLVRLDCRGALWGVALAEIVGGTATAIAIKTNTGSMLSIRRPQPAPGTPLALAWEMGPAEAAAGAPDAA
jgi:hypothetical protein